ncbi:MAG: hypothetical protein HRF49_10715 [bacterium]|jgi:predicted nucleic-acid-binding Zn-ribbon protein
MTDAKTYSERDYMHDRRECPKCGHTMVYGELSSVANFGVTKDPHFVTSYGFMQVRYDRATPVDCFMCIGCGYVEMYGRTPKAVLDPIERQKLIKEEFPALKEQLEKTRDKINLADRMSRVGGGGDESEDDDSGPGHVGV